jgi:hypothetical protein
MLSAPHPFHYAFRIRKILNPLFLTAFSAWV